MQEDAIVKCSGLDCNVCGFLETVSQAINWLLVLGAAVAILFLVISGFLYFGSVGPVPDGTGAGKKSLLLKAKQYTVRVVTGFILVLLAWLAVHASLAAIGSNSGSWWSFECELGQESPGEIQADTIAKSLKNSGEISGILSAETSMSDLDNLYRSMAADELLTFSLLDAGSVEPWAILGKKEDSLEILYLDVRRIKSLEAFRVNLLPTASAKEKDVLQEMASTIKQLVFEFIQSRKDQVVAVIRRPQNLKLEPQNISSKIPAELKQSLASVKNCLRSGGVWYRFSPENDSCKCPLNKKIIQSGSCE